MIHLDVRVWAFLASYVIHIVDETTMNGGFIRWIQASFWPTHASRMNFWFNGGAVCAIAISNLLYDLFGGHWVILALIWPFGFALRGLTVHLFWTIRQRNLSPGLVAGVIYWMMACFFVRYGFVAGQIAPFHFCAGALVPVLSAGSVL